MRLLSPVLVGRRQARNRLLFGPHETNLGAPGPCGRALSAAHVAYYARRAAGGCGVVVTETASVHDSDWPYERAPLAADCESGWRGVAGAVRAAGALTVASLGHSGLQGSSAYHQQALWGPSRFPDPVSRELPMVMELEHIDALVAAFADAAAIAARAGVDGVEIEAGQHSLLRQFLSGLTNTRGDDYGADRSLLVRQVLAAVRAAVGDLIVGLRLSCDEQAPWAGITPEHSGVLAGSLAGDIDYLVAVRAGPFNAGGHRPDTHVPEGFAVDLAHRVRAALPTSVAVVAQGSIVDPSMAETACASGDFPVDLVEMTRAQIADPDLGRKLADPSLGPPRPCVRCNQTCQVRDARNPIVTCIGEPRSGHETTDPCVDRVASWRRTLAVVGAGPAGLECARVAALRGHQVVVTDTAAMPGGAVVEAARGSARAPLAALTAWLAAECVRLGVDLRFGTAGPAAGDVRVVATGSQPRTPPWLQHVSLPVFTAREVLAGAVLLDGPVVVDDPVGGPIGVSVAESLSAAGRQVAIVSQDPVIGTGLSRTGDLAAAGARLAQGGIRCCKRSLLRSADSDGAVVEDRYTGITTVVPAAFVVDAGHLLPYQAVDGDVVIGDAVAPRTIAEAILEGRRAALALENA